MEERLRENFLTDRYIVDFDVVVHPKRKPNKWTANIEHVTLEGLKEYIRKMYQPPALENDGAELNFMNDGDKYSPRNDQDLREILRIFVSNKKLKFTVFSFMVLAMTRILTLTCSLPFHVVLQT